MSIFCFQKDPPSGLLLFGFQANQDLLFLIGGREGEGAKLMGHLTPLDFPSSRAQAMKGAKLPSPFPYSLAE